MEAGRHGVETVILSDAMEGEARGVAHVHAAIAREVADRDRPFKKRVIILSGGERTVTICGKGRKRRARMARRVLPTTVDSVQCHWGSVRAGTNRHERQRSAHDFD